MDDDWDADDFVPPPPVAVREQPKSQWDDEDEEEESPVKEPPPPPPQATQAPQAVPSKPKVEKKDKGKKTAADTTEVTTQESSDPVADKLKQQRLVEEADYKVTAELFKTEDSTVGGNTLEGFIPKSEADFLEYADLLAQKITPFEKSFHYMTLLKAVLKNASASMKAADAKELASAVTVIANEKLKVEKDAAAGKKKAGAKKKQLNLNKAADEEYSTQGYDDGDDYDFM